jgi:hypothetical protein
MTTIRLSADQNSATIPPTKAVRVRFVEGKTYWCCRHCHFHAKAGCYAPDGLPCTPSFRDDGRNGYWAKAKKGKRVRK